MRVHDLLAMPELGLDVLVPDSHRDPTIRWVVTTDMIDPSRYLTGGELVLTGLMWRTDAHDSDVFVRSIAKAGVAALAASKDGVVPPDLVDACRRHGVPLFLVAATVSFATVTETVVRQLSTGRASDLRSVLDRHRRLVATAGGSGLGPLLELVAEELGLDCAVLTPSGRVLAPTTPIPDGIRPETLARAFLTARLVPHVEQGISLFAVDGDSASRVVDWIVAFGSDWQSWPPERLALAEELVAIVALERERTDDRLGVSGRLAQQFVRSVVSGERVSEQMHLIGLDEASRYVVVAASVSGGTVRLGEVRYLLRDLLGGEPAIGVVDGEVIAVAPTSDDITAGVARAVTRLGPGLIDSDLSIGVSGVVAAGELRSAVEEARQARRLAARRTDDVRVVGHDELATLVLLLASVPDDMRQLFRSRLLDPLRVYDASHQSELIPTLATFLDCNGSWTTCSERLHLHINSVRYRIARIEELTGRDLSRLEDRVEFFLALRMT
ncbi:hypothetical protein GCM10007304_20960 [Rhodococcoides trifolii]|uniref:PucR family transcriptional regulator n=1 Tax=Rhodococcoides trifolii TaxID=908250 RepID=A0A917D1N1_9NOCA|nr:PucR family transcriptional regulator ligand-binding domain-containing protein [Rhodococcus trifolii]GGG06649.1 hypothetical protein GCM10007304_20960 [Rhodococcus trifolii]